MHLDGHIALASGAAAQNAESTDTARAASVPRSADPQALFRPSPWVAAEPSDRAYRGPYWRSAFKAELSDSAILVLLAGPPPPKPCAYTPAAIGPRLHNRMGAVGLAGVARLVNACIRAARQRA